MPGPGQANNPAGNNDYTTVTGEPDPAYGEIAKAQVLTRMAPVGSPPGLGEPKKAQRRATGGGRVAAARPSPLPGAPAEAAGHDTQRQFWVAVINDPDASPLTRQYAERALGYSG